MGRHPLRITPVQDCPRGATLERLVALSHWEHARAAPALAVLEAEGVVDSWVPDCSPTRCRVYGIAVR